MDVSVIIPTYNRLWSLPAAINSCLETKCSTEIIVIDDGSTDGTWEWLQDQKNIIKYKQDNWGKCWAVNYAYNKASGKYIRFLDSDDCLNKHANDEQFELAQKNDADIVVSGYKIIDEKDVLVKTQDWIECDDFIAQQLGECDSSHYSAYLFKKSFLADIPHRPDFAFRDDRLLVLEAALKDPKVTVHDNHSLLHRHHSNKRLQFNLGTQQTVQNYQHFRLYQKILNKLQEGGNLNSRRINAAINILAPLSHWIAKDNIKDGEAVYNYILSLKPDFEITKIGVATKLYEHLGFKKTSELLFLRRLIKSALS